MNPVVWRSNYLIVVVIIFSIFDNIFTEGLAIHESVILKNLGIISDENKYAIRFCNRMLLFPEIMLWSIEVRWYLKFVLLIFCENAKGFAVDNVRLK